MTSRIALISLLGPDRLGLVAAIADYLFGVGANLRDTTFAALGSGAEFTAVCELPPDLDLAEVEAGLAALPETAGAHLRVTPFTFDPEPGEAHRITHRVTVSGGDQLGLVARLAEIFAQYEANIVRLEARRLSAEEGGLYVTRFAVSLRPEQAERCLTAVTSTAGALSLSCRVDSDPR